ncbi:cytochrome P450 [Ktedonosporobacter rubrisoli]|uniref:Bifunctional cytochrome P450/NADPH--P450 reductase n=1 Tax=Ktedonosporobacter rubrisoli TaxID=2509675 RepID=A0A4P6JTA2_KTERU|nr:cytochrome P450 [Ktedonosporobacter rubrisoli]QBD78545.1 cytochrome P450 [Ktedonosporobacter rubrisoli]
MDARTKSVSQNNSYTCAEIPQPAPKPLVGNLFELEGGQHVQSMISLAREYGPIFQLEFPGRQLVVVSGFDLVNELCDESRFDKKVWAPLQKVRSFAGNGLFTADTVDPDWHKAHNILLPNFSLKAMQGYLPMMVDIAEQLMAKWERMNADDEIDVPGDMTRLTLDTIGLCGFDYRFNSFYREDMHPFVRSIVRALGESMDSLGRLPLQDKLMVHKHKQLQADIDFMNNTVDRVIRERKAAGDIASGPKDLLSYMLTGVDKGSGTGLDDVNIRYQIITFLIAGHETTSGLLSFALYFLLHHPEALARAYEEVDRVLGADTRQMPTFAQVNRLKYVSQILKETLRLWPTAPMFSVYPYADTTLGGKYQVTNEKDWAVLLPMLHRDKSVWGEDAEEFNPDRFSVEAEQARPANAYKPFGNGQRACIGRQFAMQEATLVLGMILQRFQLIDHTNYQLKVKETLTLKPDNFKLRVRSRTDAERHSTAIGQVKPVEVITTTAAAPITAVANQHHTPLLVLYGSNLGTAEDLAHHIAEDAKLKGFAATVAPLDDYTAKLPTEGALIVVTASYNGTPPDNAVKFCSWLKDAALAQDALKGVRYTVFGAGNREWASTFQAIPRLIDSKLEQHGAQRIYQRGEGDASDDFDGQFQSWYQPLWNQLAEVLDLDLGEDLAAQHPLYEVEVIAGEQPSNPFVASFGAQAMKVLTNRELHTKDGPMPSERSTRHIELEMPAGVTYRAGDHLGVVASNSQALAQRVASRFNFDSQTRIRLHQSDDRKTHLPIDEPVLVFDLLTNYVELQDVANRSQLKVLAEYTQCPPEKQKLLALAGNDEASAALYREEVLNKRKALIDLLEEFPACELPFKAFLGLLAPIRPRYYSISSSPLEQPGRCSITVGVVRGPARSGHGEFCGLCSNYLAQLPEGASIYGFIRDTKSAFRLPDESTTPLIMVGPGTGLAPYRGFLQERASQKRQGQQVGSSLLFFGCRHPQQDFIYEQELKSYEEQGLITLATAFSRLDKDRKVYVQDKIKAHGDEVWQLLQDGASIYVCGDASQMAPDVRRAFAAIYQEKTGKDAQTAEQWLNKLVSTNRYLVDVWGN